MVKSDDSRSSAAGDAGSPRGRLAPGALAGDYVITHFIARGGCGSVYRARHRSLDRDAAVKVLHASLAAQPKMVTRFKREVQVIGLLEHPGIVEVYEVGSLPDGRPYYAMEYLEGRTLAKILEEEGRLSPAEALGILVPVCAALEAAHAAGVIHRDVKASNIMVGDGDPPEVKLLDFGIAKLMSQPSGPAGLTTEGRHVGTLTIMAPEQLLGGPVDARIDVYALGILLFRLLTGRLPFDGKNPLTLAQQHLEEPAPRPSQRIPMPPALDTIVLRCLEKQPDRRYESVKEFLSALRRAVGGAFPRRDSAPLMEAHAVAVYVEILLRTDRDDVDEALSEDMGRVLDAAEEALVAEGFLIASATGSDVLGVCVLADDPAAARRERAAALRAAAALRRRVDGRAGADPRVRVNVCAHAGLVMVRNAAPREVVGGTLVRTDLWVPRRETSGLCATHEAVDGLSGFDVVPGPGVLVTLRDQPA